MMEMKEIAIQESSNRFEVLTSRMMKIEILNEGKVKKDRKNDFEGRKSKGKEERREEKGKRRDQWI